MIKKNAQGKVVEFEDEAAMAAMQGSKGQRASSVSRVFNPKDEKAPMTAEEAQVAYETAVREAEENVAAEINTETAVLMLAVTDVTATSTQEKHQARATYKKQVSEAEVQRAAATKKAEAILSSEMESIWNRYRKNMASINTKMEEARSASFKKLADMKTVAFEERRNRLADIARATAAAEKLAVVAEAQTQAAEQ
jgi:hypothetical protein